MKEGRKSRKPKKEGRKKGRKEGRNEGRKEGRKLRLWDVINCDVMICIKLNPNISNSNIDMLVP